MLFSNFICSKLVIKFCFSFEFSQNVLCGMLKYDKIMSYWQGKIRRLLHIDTLVYVHNIFHFYSL